MVQRSALYDGSGDSSCKEEFDAGFMVKKIVGIERLAHHFLPASYLTALAKGDKRSTYQPYRCLE